MFASFAPKTTALFALVVALAFSACSKRETAVEAAVHTQTLHVGNAAEPPDLDPHTNNSANVAIIDSSLFEGLVSLANDGTTILPGVAERWEISPDGLVYTFHLRADAVWSNGDPLTSADFLAGFHRFLEPALGCEGVNIIFPVVGARDFVEGRSKDFSTVGIRTPDPLTVELRLRFRAPYFLSIVADPHFVPLHQPSLDKFNGRTQRGGKWTQPGNLVSNGPFTLKSWRPNEVLVVVKNPRYWDAAHVRLNEVRFYPIEDSAAEERSFRTGQLHVTNGLPYGKLDSYRQRRAPELHLTPVLGTNYVTFSTGRPPFADVRVRRAFSLAIDRDQLAATILKDRANAAHAFVRPGVGGYQLGEFSHHDAAEAKKLLREAGFPDGAGFPAVEFMLSSRDENVITLGQALQQMWSQTLGVKVELRPTETKVWLDALRTKSFAFTTDNWNMGFNDPSDMLALAVTADPNNDAGWSNARYDVAFAKVNTAATEAERRAAMVECEQLIAAEVPYAPVYHTNKAQLVHASVHGWRDNALGAIDWRELWLEAPP